MFDVQGFIASCQQFVGAPDGTRRVLDLVRSVVGDAQGIKSAIVPGGDSPRAIRDLMLFRSPELFEPEDVDAALARFAELCAERA